MIDSMKREKRLTFCSSTTQITQEFLTSFDKHTPRIDVTSTSLTSRRSSLSKIDDRYRSFFWTKVSERLNDESEGELRSDGEIIREWKVVGCHP